MRANALRGLAAVAFVVVLLSSSLRSTAVWSAEAHVPSATVSTGRLGLVQHPMTITLTRGGTSTDVSSSLAKQALLPGDVLTYRVPITPVLKGDNLKATLTLDVTGLAGDTEEPLRGIVRASRVTVATEPQGLLTDTAGPWLITPALDGKLVTGIVTVAIPASAGAELQGRTLDQGSLRWVLTQA